LTATHYVNQLVTLAQHNRLTTDNNVRGGYLGINVISQVTKNFADGFELDASIEKILDNAKL
jgi:hypothetical protein